MKLNALVVVSAALLLSSGTGVAAYALAGDVTSNPTDSGNSLPIDDNHAASATASPTAPSATSTPPTATARHEATPAERATLEPGDDHGVHATPEAEHATPEVEHPTPEAEHPTLEPGDDNGVDAAADDHGGSSGDSGKGGSSGSGKSGGSDDGSGHH